MIKSACIVTDGLILGKNLQAIEIRKRDIFYIVYSFWVAIDLLRENP